MATLIKRPIRPSTKLTKKTAEKPARKSTLTVIKKFVPNAESAEVLKKALPTTIKKAVWGNSKKALY